jgi:hypothetical protein
VCNKCGKNYNIADIYLPAQGGQPEIVMPPLSPPQQCLPFMEQRADDTDEVVRRRLEVGGRCCCCWQLACVHACVHVHVRMRVSVRECACVHAHMHMHIANSTHADMHMHTASLQVSLAL